tara:strand:- start:2552 stop:3130 length:579 start_codon:yes stop_codon:yes gene_type:complete
MENILYIASKNLGKIKEYKKMLSSINCDIKLQPQAIEVIESGKTFRDNAILKASEVSKKTKSFAIADDSGLCIESLDGSPGIFSSRYGENDQKRIERVLRELEHIDNRNAFFVANVCLSSPEGELLIDVEAKCFGEILMECRGSNGFGYDPIFEELSTKLTFAEMSDEMKYKLSHRGKAIKKIIPKLKNIFN